MTPTTIDPIIQDAFFRFFDDTPISAELIDTSREDSDFRQAVIVSTEQGNKYVLKFAANDFTSPDRIQVWKRTVEEYRNLGYYCPQIYCDKHGDFPFIWYQDHACVVYAEEFSKYPSVKGRDASESDLQQTESRYREDVWRMTARIAAKKLDYADFPSAYCLFETFCPSDKVDEVLENAMNWKEYADTLPVEFSAQVQRIWTLWNDNRAALQELFPKLPTSVFQADLNATNLLIDENGRFQGLMDFNLCGREVFLNYLMRENDSETIPAALKIAGKYYRFSEEEKVAALPLFRCLKPLWWSAIRELKKAANDREAIQHCLDRSERLLTEDKDFSIYMN